MLITIFSILFAILIGFYSQAFQLNVDFSFLALMLGIVGTILLLAIPLLRILTLNPLQRLEQTLIPRLVDLFYKDHLLRLSLLYLILFSFFCYGFATLFLATQIPYKLILLTIWLVGLGLALDVIRYYLKRTELFLNPFYLIELFIDQAKGSIRNDKDPSLWDSLDSLSEIALQATERNKIALSTQSLSAFPPIIKNFFASSKSISRSEGEAKSGQDEISYTIFYLLQRLQTVFDKALQQNLETICSQFIIVLGKIIIHCARFDLSMVSFPTYFLGRCALKAQKQGLNEIANLSTSTLMEVSRTILTEVDLSYQELQTPFEAIIAQLDEIAKETFKKDKSINIRLLMQPFIDLRELFQSEKMANHQDTAVIVQSINNRLVEFETLEQVMRTIPPISTIIESSTQTPTQS